MTSTSELFSSSHSGAGLLIRDGLVVKTLQNNERSKLAIQSQSNFKEIKNRDFTLRSVPIYSMNESHDTLEITMPYIHGLSGENIALSGDPDLALQIKEILSMYIAINLSKCVREAISAEVFINKIKSLDFASFGDIFSPYASDLVNIIESLPSLIYLPIGDCHGDLTFSNLIYNGVGVLYIYDFLPSFINSPIIDYAKIRQEFYHGWTLRNLRGGALASGLQFIKSSIPVELISMIEKSYLTESKLLSILNLLRIAPYVRNGQTADWVRARLDLEFKSSALR